MYKELHSLRTEILFLGSQGPTEANFEVLGACDSLYITTRGSVGIHISYLNAQ